MNVLYRDTKATKEAKQRKIRAHDIWEGNIQHKCQSYGFFGDRSSTSLRESFFERPWPATGAKGCLTACQLPQHVRFYSLPRQRFETPQINQIKRRKTNKKIFSTQASTGGAAAAA